MKTVPETVTPDNILFGGSSWGYDMACGWKQGLGWCDKLQNRLIEN